MNTTTRSETPVVPSVAHEITPSDPWQVPELQRLWLVSHTNSGVRIDPSAQGPPSPTKSQKVVNRPAHLVFCLADDAAWQSLVGLRNAWQAALDELAKDLLGCGRYDRVLAAAANPPARLTPFILHVNNPPGREYSKHFVWTGEVPEVRSLAIAKHTGKKVRPLQGPALWQTHCFLGRDEAVVASVLKKRAVAQVARKAYQDLLLGLGTYAAARADRRYS